MHDCWGSSGRGNSRCEALRLEVHQRVQVGGAGEMGEAVKGNFSRVPQVISKVSESLASSP